MSLAEPRRVPDQHWRFAAIGTEWVISTFAPLPLGLRGAVSDLIEDYDRTYSRFRPDSMLTQAARAGGTLRLPEHSVALADAYRVMDGLSAGAISPWVGSSLAALGYDDAYRLDSPSSPLPALGWAAGLWNGQEVQVPRGALLDIGCAGKGQLVDLVTVLLFDAGVDECLVDASGDLRAAGDFSVRVGLEHPYDANRVIGVVEVDNLALAASASNRRAWGDGLHHIIDARTGVPVQAVVASWAVAPTALSADAAASALFFADAAAVETGLGAKGLRVFSDGKSAGSTEMMRALW